jgi:ectoine hydroxylase-related dioxygenase (phytanoyl-CoA dioxygenase family)
MFKPRKGGFCYIPGSHKATDPRDGRTILKELYKYGFNHHSITVPTLNPGDVVMFLGITNEQRQPTI